MKACQARCRIKTASPSCSTLTTSPEPGRAAVTLSCLSPLCPFISRRKSATLGFFFLFLKIRPKHLRWEELRKKKKIKLHLQTFPSLSLSCRGPRWYGGASRHPSSKGAWPYWLVCVNTGLKDCKSSLYQNQFEDSKQSIEEFCS